MKILIVDDSIAYRRTISKILAQIDGVEIIGEVHNGSIAIQKLQQHEIDLITLDMEMPVMDGISTLKKMNELKIKAKVIIFASQSSRGAQSALEAFRLGAVDIIPKPTSEYDSINQAMEHVKDLLLPKIIAFKDKWFDYKGNKTNLDSILGKSDPKESNLLKSLDLGKISNHSAPVKKQYPKANLDTFRPRAIVIGSSTGGPTALETIFNGISGIITIPIFVAQHMPPLFTKTLSERIEKITQIPCREAINGEEIKPQIYFAPGDFHMEITQDEFKVNRIKLHQGPKRHNVRPAVDNLFETAASIYGRHCLGIVLTGMGYDGAKGSEKIKESHGAILIQDRETSTVWGMPGAVFDLGCYDRISDISNCNRALKRALKPLGVKV